MFRGSLAAVAAVAVVSFAAPASAATLMIEASGAFTGYDPYDLLGLPKDGFGQVTGAAFSLSLAYDVGAMIREDQAGTDVIVSGTNYGGPTASQAVFTIGGVDYTLYGHLQGTALASTVSVAQSIFQDPVQNIILGANFEGAPLTPFVDQPPAGNICLTGGCSGTVRLGNGISGMFDLASYTITFDPDGSLPDLPGGPSPAPEPTTWALMIAGFGLAGAALRRRRLATAATA